MTTEVQEYVRGTLTGLDKKTLMLNWQDAQVRLTRKSRQGSMDWNAHRSNVRSDKDYPKYQTNVVGSSDDYGATADSRGVVSSQCTHKIGRMAEDNEYLESRNNQHQMRDHQQELNKREGGQRNHQHVHQTRKNHHHRHRAHLSDHKQRSMSADPRFEAEDSSQAEFADNANRKCLHNKQKVMVGRQYRNEDSEEEEGEDNYHISARRQARSKRNDHYDGRKTQRTVTTKKAVQIEGEQTSKFVPIRSCDCQYLRVHNDRLRAENKILNDYFELIEGGPIPETIRSSRQDEYQISKPISLSAQGSVVQPTLSVQQVNHHQAQGTPSFPASPMTRRVQQPTIQPQFTITLKSKKSRATTLDASWDHQSSQNTGMGHDNAINEFNRKRAPY